MMLDPQPIHQVLNAAWRRKIQICSIACIVLGVFSICLEVGYVNLLEQYYPIIIYLRFIKFDL